MNKTAITIFKLLLALSLTLGANTAIALDIVLAIDNLSESTTINANAISSIQADLTQLSNTVAIDGNGNTIGTVIGAAFPKSLTLLSTYNYIFVLAWGVSNKIEDFTTIEFDEPSCSGNMYISSYFQGYLYETSKLTGGLYYVPHNAEDIPFTVRSKTLGVGGTSCTNLVYPSSGARLYPNDSVITGVKDVYPGPIKVQRP